MKRKILSISLALVLVLSFGLVTAAPVAGATTADYNAAVIKAADRLVTNQDSSGGFAWILGGAPATNCLGITAIGILKAHELEDKAAYETALAKAYKYAVDNAPGWVGDPILAPTKWVESPKGVDSFTDVTYLVWLAEAAIEDASLLTAIEGQVPGTTATSIAALAKDRWDGRLNHMGSTPPDDSGTATLMAESIRNARHGQNLDALIPWDLEAAVKAALALDTYYPLQGYDLQAIAIAAVLRASVDDTGSLYFSSTSTSQSEYVLGLTGAIEAFVEVGAYSGKVMELKDLLIGVQHADGYWDFHGGAIPTPMSVQSTAYAVMALLKEGGADAVVAAQKGVDWLVSSQLLAGGWYAEGGAGDEYLEIDSEAAWALATITAPVLDEDWYRTGETVFVTVEDPAAGGSTSEVEVTAVSDYDPVGITVVLTQGEPNIYEGSFQLIPEELEVADDDLITVTYLEVTDTATVDDTLPVITINTVSTPTSTAVQTISGTFTELNLDTITLTVNDGLPQTAAVDEPAGTWEVVDVPLVEVDNFIVATITDMIGNSATADAYIELDTTPPGGYIDIPDFINSANVGTVPVTIGSDEDGIFSYDIGGGMVVGHDAITAGLPFEVALDLSVLPDGPVTASVTFTDGHGNVSNPIFDQAFKDTLVPAAPSSLDAPAYINDANQTTYTVTGTAEPVSTVEVRITDGPTTVTNTGTATGGGAFSIAVDCSTLADGTGNIIINAKATDAAGNEGSYCSAITRSKDATLPTVVIDSEAPDPTNTSPIVLTATFSEPVTGFELGDITVGNGTITRFTDEHAPVYLFTVTPTADGLVTVDIAARVAFDAADNPNMAARQFTITYDSTPPEVTVISPNGGENWLGGSTHDITWTATDANLGATPVTIKYSLNGGTNWDIIVANVANTGAYSWTVPNLSSIHCLVSVIAVDLAHNVGHDASNSFFVMSSDTLAPAVTVNSPNGGEIWQGGSTQTITWTAMDDKTPSGSLLVDLYYSLNGGTNWLSIATSQVNNGAYSWPVPESDSSQCLVKVGATDTSGGIGFDVSDRVFTITTPGAPPVATTTINLETGWNLISLMLIPTSSNITDVLGDIPVDSVWAYDASIEDPAERWSWYKPGLAPGDLETMVDGKGYWIDMGEISEPVPLTIQGQELPDPPAALPAYNVVEGWNLIGFKSTTPRTADSYLLAIDGKYTLIRGYETIYFTVGTGEDLAPGNGYWISVVESGTIYP